MIDDEEGICRALQRLLYQHEVITVKHGYDAKETVTENDNFDAILCDMMMPGVTGMDFHQWLANTYPHLASRVVFITGGAFTPVAQEYLNSSGVPCINKPFDSMELSKTVNEMIGAPKKV
ncbi:MAG: response regulator [Deltaproteobacteria bacterium]|nr:response regulator [Deltaproteobacteria bacterium]